LPRPGQIAQLRPDSPSAGDLTTAMPWSQGLGRAAHVGRRVPAGCLGNSPDMGDAPRSVRRKRGDWKAGTSSCLPKPCIYAGTGIPDDWRRLLMAIGPVQLIVLGFNHPQFHGEIISELERLRESDTVRVIDSLAVYKDADGGLEVEHLSNLSEQEAIELGSKIGALIGLGIEGEEGAEAGAIAGAERAAAEGIDVFGEAGQWDVLEDIPFRLGDGFISPLDLVEIGLMSADEAKDLHAMETSAAATRS